MDPSLASWYVHATTKLLLSASFHLLVDLKGNARSVVIVKIWLQQTNGIISNIDNG